MDSAIEADMEHVHRMRTDPEYAARIRFEQETANQGLEDRTLDFIGMFKGLGSLFTGKAANKIAADKAANLYKQQQALRAGAQAKTAELFDVQDALRELAIQRGVDKAKQKGLGRLETLREFAAQDALRAQAISNGVTASAFKQEMRRLGMNPD